MNKSTAAFIGVKPKVDIEYVVRLDDPGSLTRVVAGKYLRTPSTDSGSYDATLDQAERFAGAAVAAAWIQRRQRAWYDRFGGHFSIVPVKVTTTPAVTEARQITTAQPDTYVIRYHDSREVAEVFLSGYFRFTDIGQGQRFPTPQAAADVIAARNALSPFEPGELGIYPVHTPAKVTTEIVEVSPAVTMVELY